MQKPNVLSKMLQSKSITSDGKEWLTLALDPFHDYTHQVAGYPDADCSQTVVSCYQYQLDVSAPANAAGGNWDCHVYNMPQAESASFPIFTEDAGWTSLTEDAVTARTFPTGPLTIVSNVSGAPLGVVPVQLPATAETITTLPPIAIRDISSGISRVIGMGYEITNTTAEIYKQGTLTAYRMPQMANQFQQVVVNNAGTQKATYTGVKQREPPSTVAQANLLRGTLTWAAAEGAYVVCMQNSVTNPLMQEQSSAILYDPNPSPSGNTTLVRGEPYTTVGVTAAVATIAPGVNQIVPFDTTGVFLTNLSNGSSLTIKLKVYVERAPTYAEPSIAVLASPSAAYDMKVLQLYAAAVPYLPIAVKVNENGLGDWWRAVCSVLKTAAGPLGLALNPFVPGAGLVGGVVSHVAGQLSSLPGQSVSKMVAKDLVEQKKEKNKVNVMRKPPPPRNRRK